MAVLLDTDLVPERERTDALHAVYAGVSPRRNVVVHRHPVRHRVERVEVGSESHVLRSSGSPLQIVRTSRQVRLDAPEYVAVGFRRLGDGFVATAAGDAESAVGHLVCVDTTTPYRLAHTSPYAHDVLMVSNRQLGVSVDVVRAAVPVLERSPLYDLVRSHVAGLFDATAQLRSVPRLLTGDATAGLLRALLTTAAEVRGRDDALEDALEARIAHYVDAHLGDPDLSTESIAAAHHISRRHLYNIWARAHHERTPGQWILDRRLRRAREQLGTLDPARTAIATIARQCGFADSSHFSRRFREAFGTTPREWRAGHNPRATRRSTEVRSG